jgi:DNA-binding transcriptional LysR family regulator
VTAPVAFSTLHVAPALSEFLARYHQVRIELTLSDRFVDLAQEGFDLAIRIASELTPNLVARPLAKVHRVVCGSREYFARHPIPATPQDLTGHNCLIYTHGNPRSAWHFTGPQGDLVVPVRGSLTLNDNEALWQAVRGGVGIAMLPTFIVGEDLQAGKLRAVLSDYVPAEKMIYAVYLSNRNLSAKVRVFIDFLVARFQPPYWDLGWTTQPSIFLGSCSSSAWPVECPS